MTTLSSLPRAQAQLFERIDAARPSDPLLQAALETWQARRSDRLLPGTDDVVDLLRDGGNARSFLFRRQIDCDDWTLAFLGAAVSRPFGEPRNDCPLSELPARRLAVRLRHLMRLVADTAEPLSAIFHLPGDTSGRQRVEVVVAPLSSGRTQVDAILGALVLRPDRSA